MSYQYLLEIDIGKHIKRWGTTGTTGVFSHTFTDLDPAAVYVDGTQLGERITYGSCAANQTTWYVSRGTTLYIHTPGNADANAATVKVESTLHFSRQGAIIPKALGTGGTVFPLFYDGRMETIPSVSYHASPNVTGGGVVPSIGQIVLLNNDAYFDSLLPQAIWKNQPARLYVGEEGGTLPAGYTLRQQFYIDAPAIDEITMVIPTAAALERLMNPINDGSTISVFVDGLSVSKPSPMVYGPFMGIPAYFTGSSGTVGTYQICSHNIGTVNRIWNSSGTLGTLINSGSKFSAHPLSILGQSQVYVNGTGFTWSDIPKMKAGDIMHWILLKQAKISDSLIATGALDNLDTLRPVNIMAWFGRNETIADAMDAVSRSAFTNWSVGRDGKYSVNLIQNILGTSQTINNYDFELGTPTYPNGMPLEDLNGIYPVRVSNSKMLIYNDLLLKDATAGLSVYRATTFGSAMAGSEQKASMSMVIGFGAATGDPRLYCFYTGTPGGENALEVTIGTGFKPLFTANKIINGTRTLLGSATTASPDLSGTKVVMMDTFVNAGGTTTIQIDTSADIFTVTIDPPQPVGSGYIAVGWGTCLTALGVGTLGWWQQGGTSHIETYPNLILTDWTNNNGAAQEGTIIGNRAFSGTQVLAIKRGTDGGSAHIAYEGIPVTSGSNYIFTLLAAKQSGDASAFRLGFLDGGGTQYLSATSWGLGTTQWTRANYILKPQSTGTGTLQIAPSYGGTLAGTCWVDYVEMYQIKTINSWQLKGFSTQLVNPIAHQVSVKYAGTGTITSVPAEIMKTNIEGDDKYFTATAAGTISSYLYPGMERRVIPALCYAYEDATTIANAALLYYSKPRIRWEADYEDFRQDTINLWDVLYIQDGRFPGIPEEQRLLMVTEIEDSAPSGVPRTHIGGEFVFDAANDLLQILYD